ncbi:DUF2585 family protein [Paracoccus lichenicola]|uniref:DUF2585 family protein n=1 Tax=Paracoccus lichenicola TaxID=2665644 RepID=UPI0018A90F2F|nr:DUF2585 family protein [Paracoccus lichenicola]
MRYDHIARCPHLPLPATPAALEVAIGILFVNGAVACWLLLLGRGVLPDAVPLQWWSASTLRVDNSQHFADFYSALHAVWGAALCFVSRAIRPEATLHRRFLVAIGCSGVWEVVENTPFVISLFNDPAGLDVYRGDSIINALSDSAFVALGFLAAHKRARWIVIVAGVSTEAAMALMIHDGFVLGTARALLP